MISRDLRSAMSAKLVYVSVNGLLPGAQWIGVTLLYFRWFYEDLGGGGWGLPLVLSDDVLPLIW